MIDCVNPINVCKFFKSSTFAAKIEALVKRGAFVCFKSSTFVKITLNMAEPNMTKASREAKWGAQLPSSITDTECPPLPTGGFASLSIETNAEAMVLLREAIKLMEMEDQRQSKCPDTLVMSTPAQFRPRMQKLYPEKPEKRQWSWFWAVYLNPANGHNDASDLSQVFLEACTQNYTVVCLFLLGSYKERVFTQRFGDDPVESPKRDHFGVCKFLKEHKCITRNDLYGFKYVAHALVWAAKTGNLEMCQFLKDWSVCNVRVFDNRALRTAAEHGHVHILQFFKDHWGLTTQDVRACGHYILVMAAKNGHLGVLQFVREWGLTVSFFPGRRALLKAKQAGHGKVVEFLNDWFAEM